MSERWIETEIRAALDETYQPAPELLAAAMAGIRDEQPRRRSWTWVAGLVAVSLALGTVAVFVSTPRNPTPHPNSASASLPKPIPQPITRTTLEAQIA